MGDAPSRAETTSAHTTSLEVAPVTQDELLGNLDHPQFTRPSWVEARSWLPDVQRIRNLLETHLAGLSLPVSQTRVDLKRQVCDAVDRLLLEKGVSVTEMRTRCKAVIRLLERWLTLRLRLQTAKQYPALVRLAQASEGKLYVARIQKNRPTNGVVEVLREAVREFKAVYDSEETTAWQLIGEYLGKAAGIERLAISFEEPPAETAAEVDTDDTKAIGGAGEEGESDDDNGAGEKPKRKGQKKAPHTRSTPDIFTMAIPAAKDVLLRHLAETDRYEVEGSFEVELLIDPLHSVGRLRQRDGHLVYGVITPQNLDWVRRSHAKPRDEIRLGAFFSFRVSLPAGGSRGVLLDPPGNLAAEPFLMDDDISISALGLFADIKLRPFRERFRLVKEARVETGRTVQAARGRLIARRAHHKAVRHDIPATQGEKEIA